jgi:hypothetical protein
MKLQKKYSPTPELIELSCGVHNGLSVQPRRLAQCVWISQKAFSKLLSAQENLPSNVRFILLRGYEPGSPLRQALRQVFRKLGALVFQFVFPNRADEAREIFHPNGHDIDGNHIDVGLLLNGSRVYTLPFDVFTPAIIISRNSQNSIVEAAWLALTSAGFRVHTNRTESLQIHCDLG